MPKAYLSFDRNMSYVLFPMRHIINVYSKKTILKITTSHGRSYVYSKGRFAIHRYLPENICDPLVLQSSPTLHASASCINMSVRPVKRKLLLKFTTVSLIQQTSYGFSLFTNKQPTAVSEMHI